MKKIGVLFLFFVAFNLNAQKLLIDEVIAVVGSEAILRSDVENQVQQTVAQGMGDRSQRTFAEVFERIIIEKMMYMEARFDSVTVSEDQVNGEIERRLAIFIQQAGGKDKLEEMLGKTLDEIRMQFKSVVEEQLLVQQIQQQITGKAKVTPGEISDYFNAIPKDSLPYIPSEVKIGQLVLSPPIRQDEKDKVINKLREIRKKVYAGTTSFTFQAKLNSEDLGSAPNGGELGFLRREDLVQNFAAAAFALVPDSISDVIETEFGFHIIQMIEKRGEYANFRHILIKPKVLTNDIYSTIEKMDSINNELKAGTLTFQQAALKFSTDEDTKQNGGLLINPINGSNKFTMDELAEIDATTFRVVERMKVGDMTKPDIYDVQSGGKMVKIYYLVEKTEPHVANLETDYAKIQVAALTEKKRKFVFAWVEDKKDDFYIKVSDEFKNYPFQTNWYNIVKKIN